MLLTSVHAQLVAALSSLDEMGEYVAAAHLLAAIETLEDRHDLSGKGHSRPDDAGPVTTMAKRMIDTFGDRAQAVAREQLENANGTAFVAWAAIINRIRYYEPQPHGADGALLHRTGRSQKL